MWMWIMIAVVIAMVVGPIMMLRPTPSMNMLANMRSHASKRGMSVRIPRRGEDGAPIKAAIYSLPISEPLRKREGVEAWELKRCSISHDVHFHEHWNWEGKGRLPESAHSQFISWIQSLPHDGISLVECNLAGVGVLWDERSRGKSPEDAVDEIYTLIEALIGLMEDTV